jgi:hypothetical protein
MAGVVALYSMWQDGANDRDYAGGDYDDDDRCECGAGPGEACEPWCGREDVGQ